MIRRGNLDDAASMAEIYNHWVRTSPVIFSDIVLSAGDMRAKLVRLEAGTRFPFIVAEDHGRVAGYAYAHHWQPDPVYDLTWELTMYLDLRARGAGLGSAMMARLLDECRHGGAHTLIACVTEGNAACEKMLVNAGFKVAGRLPQVGYKFGQYYTDVIYQLMM